MYLWPISSLDRNRWVVNHHAYHQQHHDMMARWKTRSCCDTAVRKLELWWLSNWTITQQDVQLDCLTNGIPVWEVSHSKFITTPVILERRSLYYKEPLLLVSATSCLWCGVCVCVCLCVCVCVWGGGGGGGGGGVYVHGIIMDQHYQDMYIDLIWLRYRSDAREYLTLSFNIHTFGRYIVKPMIQEKIFHKNC